MLAYFHAFLKIGSRFLHETFWEECCFYLRSIMAPIDKELELTWGCLFELLGFFYYIYYDRDMLIALMERWDPNSNTFHLPIREITMTLKDLYRITRLPIRGKLVNMAPILSMERAKEGAMWITSSYEVNHKKRGCSFLWVCQRIS